MKLPITLKFDDFYKLTETMFESNPLIEIGTTQGVIRSISDLDIEDSMLCHNLFSKGCTITSIEVRKIEFSIGDTIMIVDTKKVGYIGKYNGYDNRYDIFSSKEGSKEDMFNYSYIDSYQKEKLVKIPHDLLHKLQD